MSLGGAFNIVTKERSRLSRGRALFWLQAFSAACAACAAGTLLLHWHPAMAVCLLAYFTGRRQEHRFSMKAWADIKRAAIGTPK